MIQSLAKPSAVGCSSDHCLLTDLISFPLPLIHCLPPILAFLLLRHTKLVLSKRLALCRSLSLDLPRLPLGPHSGLSPMGTFSQEAILPESFSIPLSACDFLALSFPKMILFTYLPRYCLTPQLEHTFHEGSGRGCSVVCSELRTTPGDPSRNPRRSRPLLSSFGSHTLLLSGLCISAWQQREPWLGCMQIGVPAQLSSFTCVATWTTSYPSLGMERIGASGQKLIETGLTLI